MRGNTSEAVYIVIALIKGVLDISLGGEVRRGPSYPDPV